MAPGLDPSGAPSAARTLLLAAEPTAPARARAELLSFLDGATLTAGRLFDLQLLVSELVSNAVLHGSGAGDEVEVTYERRGNVLRVAVTDAGRNLSPPVVRVQSAENVSGRGLHAVAQLSDDWAVEARDGRCAVWFSASL